MNLLEQRKALLDACKSIAEGAKASGRDLTSTEIGGINEKLDQVKGLDDQIVKAKQGVEILNRLGQLGSAEQQSLEAMGLERASTLGDNFVKHAAKRLAEVKGSRFSVSAPEYSAKAPVDHATTGLTFPQIDTSVTQGYRRQAVVADLLGSGTMTSTSITYYVENPTVQGGFGTVGELGQKPQLSYAYATVTETLTKIAGFIKISDEMTEDLAFLVSEINGRLLYDLSIFEESQLLQGDGTAPNLRGILNRAGILTETSLAEDDNADAIFRAITAVQNATGLAADGIVIHPSDYQAQRLAKDANGQYYGGGPFTGAYGTSGPAFQPPIWGLRTVVTSAVTVGTAVVAAWAQGGTVYRKGGVRVESTNSDGTDFEFNRIAIRAEERLALAVRKPSCFCKVTLLPPVLASRSVKK